MARNPNRPVLAVGAAAFPITFVLAFSAACGTLAPDPNPPGPLPHGGTGEFRPMESEETGIRGQPAGLAMSSRNAVVESAAALPDGPLFYSGAAILEEPPPQDPMLPPGDVDWNSFEPLTIRRAPPREGEYGFGFPGIEVLAASEPWEMGQLMTPWPVVLPDGRLRLYYAAPGGIGVAEAPNVEGAVTRVGGGPIIATVGTDIPRRPTVVRAPDDSRWLMYYELDGRIIGADSVDGVSFTTFADPLDVGAFVPRDDSDPDEVGLAGPGAVIITTGVDRTLVRLYFESRREDGSTMLMMSGSSDGVTFERYEIPVTSDDLQRDPAPILVDSRTTIMYVSMPRDVSDRQSRAVVGTIAPRTVSLAPDAGM